MAEYIECEATLNAIKDEIDNYQPNPDLYSIAPYEFVRRGLNIAYSIIKNQPTADVQEVVRCKDCSFYEEIDYFPDGKKYVCKLFNGQMQENDFCSYGTKMDKECKDG